MYKNVTIIVNPISGGRKSKHRTVEMVRSSLVEHGATVVIEETTGCGEATRFASLAVSRGQQLVVALGGDGTANEVATGLVDSEVPMAIVPMGSGNGLARSLRIPCDVRQAINLVGSGTVAAIDVGKVNERYFFLVMGVGFDAYVGQSFARHRTRGPLSYFYLGIRDFFSYTPETLEMNIGGQTIHLAPFVLAAANGEQYGNNATIAPGAKIDDGLLNISVIHRWNLVDAFTQMRKVFTARIDRFAHASFYEAESLTIKRERAGVINLDGEPVHESPELKLSVKPRCLNVIVPENCPALIAE